MPNNIEFNVRMCQIQKTHAEWMNVTTPLEDGELVITTGANPDGSGTAILVAIIGDGSSTYSQLFTAKKFLCAPASDVYAWAKADKKPEYSSDEVKVGQPVDQSYADYWNLTITEALEKILDDIKTVSANASQAAGDARMLVGEDGGMTAREIASDELAAKLIPENAAASLNELKEIAAWIQKHPGDASAMNLAIESLRAMLVGLEEYDTVVDYVDGAIEALKIGDYAKAIDLSMLGGRVTIVENRSHNHENQNVLDGISSEKILEWDAKLGSDDVAAIAKTGSTDDLTQGTKTIVLRCVI